MATTNFHPTKPNPTPLHRDGVRGSNRNMLWAMLAIALVAMLAYGWYSNSENMTDEYASPTLTQSATTPPAGSGMMREQAQPTPVNPTTRDRNAPASTVPNE